MKHINIAIDGPSGAGKSTMAKILAGHLGYVYIDTGAMYRGVALFAIRCGIEKADNAQKLISMLDRIVIDIKHNENGQLIFLNGEDVTGIIRTPQVSVAASDVSSIPEVRLKLVEMQRNIANTNNVIMDGRDIGTYVLPEAKIKIFLTADVEDRAKRRYNELIEKGQTVDFDDVLKEVIRTDREELASEFCRACGYCLPCPANIPIPMAARMKFLLGRMFAPVFLTEEWQENIRRVDDCTSCKQCLPRCPYGLDIPRLLKEHQKSFYEILAKHSADKDESV